MITDLDLFRSAIVSLHSSVFKIYGSSVVNHSPEDMNRYVLELEEKVLDISKIVNNIHKGVKNV